MSRRTKALRGILRELARRNRPRRGMRTWSNVTIWIGGVELRGVTEISCTETPPRKCVRVTSGRYHFSAKAWHETRDFARMIGILPK